MKKFENKKYLIRLEDLIIEPFYFYLEEESRISLVNKTFNIVKNTKNLAKELNCSHDTIKQILKGKTKHGRKFIKAKFLKRLLEISKMSPEEIESSILALKRGNNNRPVEVNLPIKVSSELSLVVAKAIGDGCICSDWRFDYNNIEIGLINELIKAVEKSIGKSEYIIHIRKNKCFEIKFSSTIGFILHLLEIPAKSKLNQEFKIPKWILKGNDKIKRNFLRGLYDDESCVNYNGKRIIIAFGKSKVFRKSLIELLNSIKYLLSDFDIKTGNIQFQQEYGDKIVLRFGIYGKENLKNFQEGIGSTHPNKINSLDKILKSYIDIHKTKRNIYISVINSNKPLNTINIAKLNSIKHSLAKHHLFNLYKEGKISKSKNSSPNIWWQPEKKLMNKREKILSVLKNNNLTSLEISKKLEINHGYIYNLLSYLEDQNLISHNNSHPRVWKSKQIDPK